MVKQLNDPLKSDLKLGVSGSRYPPLKLKTGTGQTGSLILGIEIGTDSTSSQNLGTGTGGGSGSGSRVPIVAAWFFKKTIFNKLVSTK